MHHCGVLNVCIGQGNRGSYLMLLAALVLHAACSLTLSWVLPVQAIGLAFAYSYCFHTWRLASKDMSEVDYIHWQQIKSKQPLLPLMCYFTRQSVLDNFAQWFGTKNILLWPAAPVLTATSSIELSAWACKILWPAHREMAAKCGQRIVAPIDV